MVASVWVGWARGLPPHAHERYMRWPWRAVVSSFPCRSFYTEVYAHGACYADTPTCAEWYTCHALLHHSITQIFTREPRQYIDAHRDSRVPGAVPRTVPRAPSDLNPGGGPAPRRASMERPSTAPVFVPVPGLSASNICHSHCCACAAGLTCTTRGGTAPTDEIGNADEDE